MYPPSLAQESAKLRCEMVMDVDLTTVTCPERKMHCPNRKIILLRQKLYRKKNPDYQPNQPKSLSQKQIQDLVEKLDQPDSSSSTSSTSSASSTSTTLVAVPDPSLGSNVSVSTQFSTIMAIERLLDKKNGEGVEVQHLIESGVVPRLIAFLERAGQEEAAQESLDEDGKRKDDKDSSGFKSTNAMSGSTIDASLMKYSAVRALRSLLCNLSYRSKVYEDARRFNLLVKLWEIVETHQDATKGSKLDLYLESCWCIADIACLRQGVHDIVGANEDEIDDASDPDDDSDEGDFEELKVNTDSANWSIPAAILHRFKSKQPLPASGTQRACVVNRAA